MVRYNYHISSDKGGIDENQDYYGSHETKFGQIFIVCDGMGGVKGGKVASELAVNTTLEHLNNSALIDPLQALSSAIEYANTVVWNQSKQNSDLSGMGTTIVALLINDEKAISCHVGDSRIYQFRRGKKVFRTEDHSKVYELVKRGVITEEQARLSNESNIILKAIGTNENVKIEINDNLSFEKGDRFMLCSDGISGALSESQILKLINQKKSPHEITEEFINSINKIGFENGGGHDNMTIAIIDLESSSMLKPNIKIKTKIIQWVVLSLLVVSLVINILQFKSIIRPYNKGKVSIIEDTLNLKQNDIPEEKLNIKEPKDSNFRKVIPMEKLLPDTIQKIDSSKSQEILK